MGLGPALDAPTGHQLLADLRGLWGMPVDWVLVHGLLGALGRCRFSAGFPQLLELLELEAIGPQQDEALGRALVELAPSPELGMPVVLGMLVLGRQRMLQGALEGIARRRWIPAAKDQDAFVSYAIGRNIAEEAWSVIWLLRAAPGWHKHARDALLEHFGQAPYKQLRQLSVAVELLSRQEFRDWKRF